MKELRFALLGAGFWAQYQLAAWHELNHVRCVAIGDQCIDKARALASRFGVPTVADDAAALLEMQQIDFVDIVTDVASHVTLIQLAAARGIPTICQKPLASSWAACQSIVTQCEDAGVPLMVHENWRWQAPLREVKHVLEEGTIGQPFRCRIEMITGFDVFAKQPALRTEANLIIADLGCHLIDLARCYFGEVVTIYCHTQRVHADILGEDVATMFLRMQSDLTVTIHMAYAETPLELECFPETRLFIEGGRGSIEVAPGGWIRVTTAAGTQARRISTTRFPWTDPAYAVAQASMVPCLENLVMALRGGQPAETNARDNLSTMKAVFAAYSSAALGLPIHL